MFGQHADSERKYVGKGVPINKMPLHSEGTIELPKSTFLAKRLINASARLHRILIHTNFYFSSVWIITAKGERIY